MEGAVRAIRRCATAVTSRFKATFSHKARAESPYRKQWNKYHLRPIRSGPVESYFAMSAARPNQHARKQPERPMIDNPGKTRRLMAELQQALPFEADMTPELAALLHNKEGLVPGVLRQTVSGVSYLGDEGGIVCHIAPPDGENAVIVSLTHLRLPRSTLLAASVIDYQRHRVKKLKKKTQM